MKKMIQPEALKVGANRISANDARSVKLDFAPMEGITGYVFRQAHAVIYGGVDRYYSPFIAPGSSHKLTSRERNDILPEHNQGLCLIPQILTHSAEDFLWVCEELAEYKCIPAGTYDCLRCPPKSIMRAAELYPEYFAKHAKFTVVESDCITSPVYFQEYPVELQLTNLH